MRPGAVELSQLLELDRTTGALYWRSSRANGKVKPGDRADHLKAKGYCTVCIHDVRYKAHHIVWVLEHGYWPIQVDHANGVRSDNRPINLRLAKDFQNAANRKTHSNNKLGIKGVHQLPSGRYRASLTYQGMKYNLGVHDTPEQAKAAYDAKAQELLGEFFRNE